MAQAKKVALKKVSSKATKTQVSPEEREAVVNSLILNHRENGRKLARSILRRWRVRMPTEEIDSIVDLALCEAARRYSPDRGASFMTFFFYHLRGHLVRAVARAAQGNNIFLAFARNAGVDTTDWSFMGTDVIWSYVPENFLMGQQEVDSPEHVMIRHEKIQQCQDACAKLDVLEREIIDRSFADEQPLVDIAKNLGYSRCHISRVKKSALDRLKLLLDGVEIENVPASNVHELPVERSRRSRRRTFSRVKQANLVKTQSVKAA